MVDLAKDSGFNIVIVQMRDGLKLAETQSNAKDDGLADDSLADVDLLDIVAYVVGNGMQNIPEARLLTHQEKFFQIGCPDYIYNAATYNPLNAKVYDTGCAVLDKVIR